MRLLELANFVGGPCNVSYKESSPAGPKLPDGYFISRLNMLEGTQKCLFALNSCQCPPDNTCLAHLPLSPSIICTHYTSLAPVIFSIYGIYATGTAEGASVPVPIFAPVGGIKTVYSSSTLVEIILPQGNNSQAIPTDK
ncbi:hypothetical protein HYFRA_00011797 [Hymenoscyphus fraxineus]|uniref:Uncharacterized protein n=1 Tax=Hymenoscyphus fraxineus TaxID=746836 RepID=A0A9N9L5B9_9HELO|nr:hypothetical protein HYFRA_00011797 [Hymenoscyphus fraxineus]